MKRNNLLFKSVAICFAVALTHCSPKESDRKRMLPDGDYSVAAEQPLQTQNQAEASRLEALINQADPLVKAQMILNSNEVDANMLFDKVIIPLRDVALNVDYLINPETRYLESENGRRLVPRAVALFNQAVIMIYKSNPSMILNTDILAKYKEIVFWNCYQDPTGNSDDLKGTCDLVSFYRVTDSNNMTYIMKLLHDQEADSNQKLMIIKVAYDMKNRRVDGPLRFMLLERLVESFQLQESQQISRERLRQDADLFANLFKIGNFQTGSSEEYTNLIRAINPWLLSRNIDDPMNPAMTDLIRIAGQSLIYEGESVSPQMQEAIDNLAYVIGPQFEQGVDFQLKNIKGEWKEKFAQEASQLSESEQALMALTTDNPEVEIFGDESVGILANLLSDVSFDKRDEYYFLAHQVYYGHYNIDDAASFWAMTQKDEMRFMEATQNLIKMQIVNNIVYTNVRMNNFYNNSQDTKLIDLISESDKEANKIRKSWSKLIVRAKAMKSFANRVVVENNYVKTRKLDEISKNVDALAKNIKFLVAYPNMFPLIHIMASQEMKDKIMTWFGPVDIDSQLIIDFFFAGRIAPFHNFGNDGNALDATEIIYAYYYSLATEIFKTYSTNEKIEFSDEDFFRVVVKRLLLAGENKIDKHIREMKEDRQEFQNALQTFQNACAEEMTFQAQENEQIANAENFDWVKDFHSATGTPRRYANNQIPFNEMGGSIYDQTNGQTGKIGMYLKKVLSRTNKGMFEAIRTNQYKSQDRYSIQAVQLAKTLLDVYKTYNKDGDQQKIEEIFNEQFQEINRLKAEFTNLYLEMDNEIKDCEWAFINRDRDLRHSLVFREMKYWGDFFDAIDPIMLPLTEDQKALLNNNSYIQMSDEDVEALEDMEVKEDVLWVKSKSAEIEAVRQEFMAYTVDEMYPEVYQNRMGYTKISPASVTTFGMDVYARLKSYLNEMYPGQYSITKPANFENETIYRESNAAVVYFDWEEQNREVAKEKFIKAGVRAFAKYLSWAEQAPSIENVKQKAEILVNMYKMNKMSLNPEVDCKTIEVGTEEYNSNCAKVTAKELIEYYKKLINFLNIDERDEIVLNVLGKDSKYQEGVYHDYIKKQDEHALYSYYDLIFKRVMSDDDVRAADSTWFMATLLRYVDSVHKRRGSTFIFPYPTEIEDIFKKYYVEWIDDYFVNNLEFLQEVKSQLEEGVEPFRFRYRLDHRVHMVGTGSDGVLDPLISDLIYGKFTGFTQQMDNETSRYFFSTFLDARQEVQNVVNGQP